MSGGGFHSLVFDRVDRTNNGTGRATVALAQEAVREVGLCGEVSPDGESICIRYENHPLGHGWESGITTQNGFTCAKCGVTTPFGNVHHCATGIVRTQ